MIKNKYFRWYHTIIDAARARPILGYTERHHVLPKSIGGTNKKANIVRLTAKEHFVCHRLLTRFTIGEDRRKMLVAVWSMSRINTQTKRPKLSARQFEIARKACAEAASLYRHSDETKKRISKALTGRIFSNDHKMNIGLSSKGRTWNATTSKNPEFGKGSRNSRAKEWTIKTPIGIVTSNCLRLWCLQNKVCESYLKKKSRLGEDHRGVMILNY